ncbi:MAG: uncharacterized protein A8A55_1375 [Amphiamblys sp. WSBS2006]|nr:MAG: uncharacterized protein A8A55_1375 [Amphiamblys sp. WSBS2006]
MYGNRLNTGEQTKLKDMRKKVARLLQNSLNDENIPQIKKAVADFCRRDPLDAVLLFKKKPEEIFEMTECIANTDIQTTLQTIFSSAAMFDRELFSVLSGYGFGEFLLRFFLAEPSVEDFVPVFLTGRLCRELEETPISLIKDFSSLASVSALVEALLDHPTHGPSLRNTLFIASSVMGEVEKQGRREKDFAEYIHASLPDLLPLLKEHAAKAGGLAAIHALNILAVLPVFGPEAVDVLEREDVYGLGLLLFFKAPQNSILHAAVCRLWRNSLGLCTPAQTDTLELIFVSWLKKEFGENTDIEHQPHIAHLGLIAQLLRERRIFEGRQTEATVEFVFVLKTYEEVTEYYWSSPPKKRDKPETECTELAEEHLADFLTNEFLDLGDGENSGWDETNDTSSELSPEEPGGISFVLREETDDSEILFWDCED